MGFSLGKVLSGVGGAINDLMGATSAQKSAAQTQYNLSNMSYNQQKEFAQNAHQWEMQDLLKTGLNPALTAGGSSAGSIAQGGKIGNSTSAVTNGNIMGIIGNIMEYKQQAETNSANIKYTQARTQLTQLQAIEQALKNENLPKEQEAILKKYYSEITANMATSAEKYTKATLNQQTIDDNNNKLGQEDINKLIDDLNDNNMSNKDKLKSAGGAVVKALLGVR